MKTLLLIVLSAILLYGCDPDNDGYVIKEARLYDIEYTNIGGQVITWKYKGHEFIGQEGMGLIHAPYCECKINENE